MRIERRALTSHAPCAKSLIHYQRTDHRINAGFRLHYSSSMSMVTFDSYYKHVQIIATTYPMHAYTCCLNSQANPRGIIYIKS